MGNNWFNLMHLLKNDYDSEQDYKALLKKEVFEELVAEK